MIHEPALKFWSESNDSRTHSEVLIWIKWFTNPLRSSDLNQMIHEPALKSWSESNDSRTHSEVLIWIKCFTNPLLISDLNQMIHKPALKFWSESNDSRTHSEVLIWIKWFTSLNQSERFQCKWLSWISCLFLHFSLIFTQHYQHYCWLKLANDILTN